MDPEAIACSSGVGVDDDAGRDRHTSFDLEQEAEAFRIAHEMDEAAFVDERPLTQMQDAHSKRGTPGESQSAPGEAPEFLMAQHAAEIASRLRALEPHDHPDNEKAVHDVAVSAYRSEHSMPQTIRLAYDADRVAEEAAYERRVPEHQRQAEVPTMEAARRAMINSEGQPAATHVGRTLQQDYATQRAYRHAFRFDGAYHAGRQRLLTETYGLMQTSPQGRQEFSNQLHLHEMNYRLGLGSGADDGHVSLAPAGVRPVPPYHAIDPPGGAKEPEYQEMVGPPPRYELP